MPAFSLPEVFLGLVPGWGGCTLLPNLIGAERAVSVIIENSLNQNKQLKGQQVFDLGIADALFEGADFLEQSLIWTARSSRATSGRASGDRPRRGLGPGRRQGPLHRGQQGARGGPGRVPRARHHRRGEERRPPAGLTTPRTWRSPT
jgi:enoyl-CoA hydratase/carnithine racemase